jgi:hypothetical protein
MPEPLRIQIIHIWHESIGNPQTDYGGESLESYQAIAQILRKEWGVFALTADNSYPHDKARTYSELLQRFGTEKDIDKALDIVELSCRTLDILIRGRGWIQGKDASEIADNAIDEINARFREHAVGYQYSDGQIIRIDDDFTHEEIVKPALAILRDPIYRSAQAEFLKAHEHYRKAEYSDALIECCKAFESTMKIICANRSWSVDKNATASALVKACLDRGLVPEFWQGHISGLKNILESAIPTPRNKLGGHGAGSAQGHDVSDELAGYVLNMTASTISFLAKAEKKLR